MSDNEAAPIQIWILGDNEQDGLSRLWFPIQERISNRRKDRNHKLSSRLVSENTFIAFSKDPIKAIKRRFGKSVTSSGHNQLRLMISYKASRTGDTIYVEPESRYSTQMCSNCGLLSGPTGLSALKVRQWRCDCGSLHDRDINAALNTLHAALGGSVERLIAV